MKKYILTVTVLIIYILLAFTGPAKAQEQEPIVFGIIPLEDARTMYKCFHPLVNYLEEELGQPVTLKIGKDYQSIMEDMGTGAINIAYLTPTTYPKSAHNYPEADIHPIIKFKKGGESTYGACIIVPVNSEITTVAEIKGKKFAFGSADSTSSHLMPLSMLIQAGIDAEKDIVYNYLGSHTNVAKAVAAGTFDAGAVKDSVATQYSEQGLTRILARSQDIPQFPICVNKFMKAEITAKILEALLKLNDNSEKSKVILTAINSKLTGCEEARKEDYDVITEMIVNIYGETFYEEK